MLPKISDTHPEAERVQIEGLRAMSPARKMTLLIGMIEAGRTLAMARVRTRYPAADPQELQRRFATLVLGEELAEKVYGPLPSDQK
jgi:hypothetical protein